MVSYPSTAAILAWLILSIVSISLSITGFVVTVMAHDWLLLVAEAIMPVLAVVHGLGHVVGFWP